METESSQELLLLLIVLMPLAGAVINGFFGRRMAQRWVTLVGVGSVAVSFVLALIAFIDLYRLHALDPEVAALRYQFYEWFSLSLPGLGEVPVNVGFFMDQLSGIMTLVVTGVGGLIHLYSVGYMGEDPGYPRFFSYLNLFTTSMLILILGSSMPVMFVGWEGVGLCSYLLIGFWYENRQYAAAGRKAFVYNRVGDFGILLGMFILVSVVGSFEFEAINEAAEQGAFAARFPFPVIGASVSLATMACLFLFLGCTGKSAQIPLFVWLPDAMAGPTPVSALIHAATMVTAGIYLCARLSPLFITSNVAMGVIALVGTFTALIAASIAVTQREIKKILAYSTVSQLGFMFAGVGVGFFAAGFFHVYTHAFFKGCLFLGAGSVMHGVHAHGDADIFKLGGLKERMPITRWTFLFSCLAIAGFPLTSGFFSKEEILLGAATQAHQAEHWLMVSVGWITLVGLAIAAVMTAFYMFRLYFLTFTGEYRSAGEGDDKHGYSSHPHESPISMTFPLLVLGVGALFVGLKGLPHVAPFIGAHLPHWWGSWLEPAVTGVEAPEDMYIINLASLLGILAMVIGIGAAWVLYRNKSEDALAKAAPARLYGFLFDKWRVDELYGATVIKPIKVIATNVGHVDLTFVDALLTRLPSLNVRALGRWFVQAQNGVMQTYGMLLVVGAAGVFIWFWNPHSEIEASIEGADLRLSAPLGLGYEYRWDANTDGTFDRGWSADPSYTHDYIERDIRGVALYLINDRSRAEQVVEVGPEWQVLDLNALNPAIEPAKDALLPMVRLEGDDLLVRNTGLGAPGLPDLARIEPGARIRVRGISIATRPLIEATLEVRNAFGNVTTLRREIALPYATRALSKRAALIKPHSVEADR